MKFQWRRKAIEIFSGNDNQRRRALPAGEASGAKRHERYAIREGTGNNAVIAGYVNASGGWGCERITGSVVGNTQEPYA